MNAIFTAYDWRLSVILSGAKIFTFPPLSPTYFPYDQIAQFNTLHFKLHAFKHSPIFYAEYQQEWIEAFNPDMIQHFPPLTNKTVILQVCYSKKSLIHTLFEEKGATVISFDQEITAGRYLPSSTDIEILIKYHWRFT